MPFPEWMRLRIGESKPDQTLWTRCPKCGELLYRRDLEANLLVCMRCTHHFRMGAQDRIRMLTDGDFEELGADVVTGDPLQWVDKRSYPAKLAGDREKSGISEAAITGFATLDGAPVALGIMDFSFRGGTMGTVVGERLTLLLESARERNVPCLICTASGGARMEEGMLALMQMAKLSAAVRRFVDSGNFYTVVLTDPTTGGVSASFAFQADVIIAESKAAIGFAGRRVIEQTIRQRLPDNFQTAEFLLEKGQIDMVVSRLELRETLGRILGYTRAAAPERPAPAAAPSKTPVVKASAAEVR